ncbi:MAG: hypothetical protein IKA80_10650 [Spirochaetaceae bacterium]|nr:hypothetical protein [Spirochaetaceae bacterium]
MKRVKLRLVLTVGCLFLVGCAPGVQPLIDDYNAMFDITSLETLVDMDRTNWWKDLYEEQVGITSNFHAPPNGTQYTWALKPNPRVSTQESPVPPDFDITKYLQQGDQSHLAIRLTEVLGCTDGDDYILTCTVVLDGKTYTDSCRILIVATTT